MAIFPFGRRMSHGLRAQGGTVEKLHKLVG
jgi:hypothetical protein